MTIYFCRHPEVAAKRPSKDGSIMRRRPADAGALGGRVKPGHGEGLGEV
jgi:hypothetical protein